jgi:predicted metal-dependent peptidase
LNCKDDYSWTRPNPRYLATGFILPSLHSQRLGKIAVAIDTSGSIDKPLLDKFLSELETLIHECRPIGVTLIDCDTAIGQVRECDPLDPLPRDFSGGGGTDFRPVFKLLEQDPPVALVYFTDLDGTFPDMEPSYPVLWAAYNTSKTAPFGATIKIG